LSRTGKVAGFQDESIKRMLKPAGIKTNDTSLLINENI
jgi:hypothetical protein